MVLQEFTRTRPSLQGAHSLAVSQKHTTIVEDDACHSSFVTYVGECYLYTRLSKCCVPANSSYQPRNPTEVVPLFPHFIDQDSEANRRFQGICIGGTKEGFTEEGIHAFSLTDICGSGCLWKGWLIPGIPHMKPLTTQPWNHRGPLCGPVYEAPRSLHTLYAWLDSSGSDWAEGSACQQSASSTDLNSGFADCLESLGHLIRTILKEVIHWLSRLLFCIQSVFSQDTFSNVTDPFAKAALMEI